MVYAQIIIIIYPIDVTIFTRLYILYPYDVLFSKKQCYCYTPAEIKIRQTSFKSIIL